MVKKKIQDFLIEQEILTRKEFWDVFERDFHIVDLLSKCLKVPHTFQVYGAVATLISDLEKSTRKIRKLEAQLEHNRRRLLVIKEMQKREAELNEHRDCNKAKQI